MKKKLSLKKKTVSLIDNQQAIQIKGGTAGTCSDYVGCTDDGGGPLGPTNIITCTAVFCSLIRDCASGDCGNTYEDPCGGGDTVNDTCACA